MNSNIANNSNEDNTLKQTQGVSSFGKRGLDVSAVIISIAVGLAFSLLVLKDFIGINLFLFSAIAIAGVGYMLYKDDNLDVKNFVYFAGVFLIYASVFFRLEQEAFTVLTFPILIFLLGITTIFSSKSCAQKGLITYLYRQFGPVARVDKIFLVLASLKKGEKKNERKHTQVLLGVLISVGLLIIVIPLMMSAEAAFGEFLENIIDKINLNIELDTFVAKTIAGGIIAMVFCGFLYTFTKDKMIGTKDKEKTVEKQDNHTLIITVLSIMGFVFLVFALVQFNSLFVSKEAIVKNTTFAHAARQGYFQLVVLSVINFVMVLACTRMQRGSNKVTRNIIKAMTTYFTVLNVYLLVSSAYKMTLYYDAYGLSVERLLVYILLAFEFIALILLLVKIYKSDMLFIKVMIYYAVAFWAIVSLINIETWVVNVNATRYEQTGELDMYYMTRMSDDASGAIKKFYFKNCDTLCDESKERIDYYYFEKDLYRWLYLDEIDIEKDIYTLDGYEKMRKPDSWLEFNFSKMGKYNDGLDVLEHYYDTGYIEDVLLDDE